MLGDEAHNFLNFHRPFSSFYCRGSEASSPMHAEVIGGSQSGFESDANDDDFNQAMDNITSIETNELSQSVRRLRGKIVLKNKKLKRYVHLDQQQADDV